jgi:hypothetical protein
MSNATLPPPPPPPAGPPQPAPPPYLPPPPAAKVPLTKRRWFLPTVVGVAAFAVGIASAGHSDPTPSQIKASSEYQALTTDLQRAKDEAAAAQTAADDAKTAQKTAEDKVAELQAAASASTDPPAPAATETTTAQQTPTMTMPNVLGKNLQLAQDTLQRLGSYVMDQQDASGLGRMQINDSNWKVCTQDPAAGAVVPTDTLVTLGSVKLTEACP